MPNKVHTGSITKEWERVLRVEESRWGQIGEEAVKEGRAS